MSRKIARITQEKKLLLANEVVEDSTKIRLDSDGRLDTDEIIEYPAELEGGRNLILNSTFQNGVREAVSGRNILINKSYNFLEYSTQPSVNAGYLFLFTEPLMQGEKYTLNFEIECEENATFNYIYLRRGVGSTGYGSRAIKLPNQMITRGMNSISITFDASSYDNINGLWLGSNNSTIKTFILSNLKLEKGSQATPWTPAPEDLGLNYPDSIQNFNSSISGNNIIAAEFIEGYPFVKPVIDDSLVLWLDGSTGNNYEQTGIWKDLSGNDNDGQLMNFDFTEDSGWVDGGLKFDGVDDYIQLPELNLNPDNFTIQVDDKIRAFNGDKVMTENGDEWGRNLIIQEYIVNGYIHTNGSIASSTMGAQATENYVEVDAGADYTYSAKSVGTSYLDIGLYDENKSFIKRIRISDSRKALYTFNVEGVSFIRLSHSELRNKAKLEKGSKATDWTPAPEDITETNIINHNTPFVENNTIHTLRFYNRALTYEEILQNYQAGQCSPLLAMRGEVR